MTEWHGWTLSRKETKEWLAECQKRRLKEGKAWKAEASERIAQLENSGHDWEAEQASRTLHRRSVIFARRTRQRQEAELERDLRTTLLKIFHAASGDAGPRETGDATPNPFSMVSRQDGPLAPLPMPSQTPHWLSERDLDAFVEDYAASGFRGPLNLYRNLDRNWHLQKAFAGRTVDVPALYIVGSRDTGLSIPGMRDIIAGQADLVPQLWDVVFLDGVGHWVPQESPDLLNGALLRFLSDVAH